MQKLLLHFVELILTKLVYSIFSLHSSINLSNNLFQHLQFSQCKYSPISQALSHSHLQLLGFKIYPLLHIPLSINYLHLHQHLLSFQRCLLLQTFASDLHLHLHILCHFICIVSLVLDIILNTLTFKSFTTSGTHIFEYRSLIYYNCRYIYLF